MARSDCKKQLTSASAPSALPRESRNALPYACLSTSTKARTREIARRRSAVQDKKNHWVQGSPLPANRCHPALP